MDTNWKYDLTLEQAISLGKRAISEATYQDSGSGGVVRIYHVHNKGWDCIVDAEDNNELVWKHREQQKVEFLRKDLFFN